MNDAHSIRRIPLAIVGMACRLPGANNLAQFWDMLVEGRSAIGDLPPEWFDQQLYYDPAKGKRNKSYTRRGAITESRQFDHDRCPIAPELARKADPTHLVMCQTAADALRHADMDPTAVATRNTGVYVGHTIGSGLSGDRDCAMAVDDLVPLLRRSEGFRNLPSEKQETILAGFVDRVKNRYGERAENDADLASNMAAGIISKGFGLTGPFMSVNAACASSLEALLLAGRALQRDKIDMAIVGGASVCTRDWLVLFSDAQSVSSNDSRPFDHRADGLIVAEAYVALVVKTLDRALADGDPVHAVIQSFGISSDGRGKSLWAPRCEGQVEAIRRAYDERVDLSTVQYIEAHATATQLGDATEIAALTEAFNGTLPAGEKIPITSVKANIGHALESAGLVGIVKTALCMRHGLIPPAMKVERLNPNIDWDAAPVRVPLQPTPWPAAANGKPRRAAVNAFGVGGLNVHVVLDEFQPGVTARLCKDVRIIEQRLSESSVCHCLPCQPIDVTNGKSTACNNQVEHADVASSAVTRVESLLKLQQAVAHHDPDDGAIAIIGAGCVFPGARNLAEYWDLLQSGRDPKQIAPNGSGHVGGYVLDFEYDWRRHKIPPKQIQRADPLQFMVLEAADEALHDSGLDRRPFDRQRTGVIVGTEFTGDFNYRLQLVLRLPRLCKLLFDELVEVGQPRDQAEQIVTALDEAAHEQWPVLSDQTGSFSASSLAGRLIKTWDLMGGGMAIDSGATSAAAALAGAVDMLVSRDCDMMFCVGAQRNMNPAARQSLAATNWLAAGKVERGPLDRCASGYVLAEGTAVLLLKRLSDARRDGDPIRAVVRDVSAVHDDEHGLAISLRQSIKRAASGANDLALIMADAVGLTDTDQNIVQAVLESQARGQRTVPVQLGSVIGQIGHAGGASAMASLVAALLALEKKMSPSVFGLQEPLALLAQNGHVLRATARCEQLKHSESNGCKAAVLSHEKGLSYCITVD